MHIGDITEKYGDSLSCDQGMEKRVEWAMKFEISRIEKDSDIVSSSGKEGGTGKKDKKFNFQEAGFDIKIVCLRSRQRRETACKVGEMKDASEDW